MRTICIYPIPARVKKNRVRRALKFLAIKHEVEISLAVAGVGVLCLNQQPLAGLLLLGCGAVLSFNFKRGGNL